MMKYALLIIAILLVSCTSSLEDKGRVWMELEPQQCGDFREPLILPETVFPYEFNQEAEIIRMAQMLSSQTDTTQSEKFQLERYTERFGDPLKDTITIYDSKKKIISEELCKACSCSKGYIRYILVNVQNKEKLEKIGWKKL